ncbi:putative transferase [Helianthus annuus]|nr:putative transferase [Helianthus annuus]
MFQVVNEVPADFRRPNPSLNVFKFADLEKATRKFSLDLLLGEGGFGKVFLCWVEPNTLAPSKQGVGVAVAVKRLNQESMQGHAEWMVRITKCTSINNYIEGNINFRFALCDFFVLTVLPQSFKNIHFPP